MKLRCPLDTYQYISQTYDEHVARARANGWAPYPTGVPGTIYYYGGIDYAVYNAPDKAAADGVVSYVNKGSTGYGYEIRIDHGDGYVTIYGHHSAINVIKGQIVKAGDIIGITGNTGNSTGPHLHFEVRLNGSPIDPQPMIDELESEDDVNGTVLAKKLTIRKKPGTGLSGGFVRYAKAGDVLEIAKIDTIWVKLTDGTYAAVKYLGENLIKLDE
jgi:hypothetical protein